MSDMETQDKPTRARATSTFLYGAPMWWRPSLKPRSSVYYWWYEYLKRNEEYRRCCESGGKGELAALYKDFGDVVNVPFNEWWLEDGRGERLFAEKARPVKLEELETPADWDERWKRDEVMVVVVPLGEPKRRINRWFNRVLNKRHVSRPGMTTKNSDADYKVTGKFSTRALEQMLLVYDYKLENPKLTMAEIGKQLRLVPSAMPKVGDSTPLLAKKRNTMGATVSRNLKKAAAYIGNTAIGKFPCADEGVVLHDN